MSISSSSIPPSALPRPGARARVEQAIRGAAQRTNTDFSFLMGQARIESALDPAAKARTSSAAGLYQFTRQTWLDTLHRHGERHGLGWASRGIAMVGGQARITDPALAGQIMNLRLDPDAAALMAGELANDNAAYLATAFGRPADHTEMYLAHFLGAEGARRFIAAHDHSPGQSAAALFPEAARANAGVFYQSGRARSLDEVRALFASKLEASGSGGGRGWAGSPEGAPFAGGLAIAHAPQSAAPAPAAPSAGPGRGAMSELIQRTFASGEGASGRTPAHVATAYARLASFGL